MPPAVIEPSRLASCGAHARTAARVSDRPSGVVWYPWADFNGTGQRAEDRADQRLPAERDRYRLARGPGRLADQAHRGVDRTPEDPRPGPPFPSRAAPDGRQAPPAARVPSPGGRGTIPGADPAPRAATLRTGRRRGLQEAPSP